MSREVILELLEAAYVAPSATNRHTWEFVVVHRSYPDRLENTLIGPTFAPIKIHQVLAHLLTAAESLGDNFLKYRHTFN